MRMSTILEISFARCIQMHLKEVYRNFTNKTVIRVTREVLCHAKHKKKHARPQRKRGMNRWLHHRRQEQKLVYFALFKESKQCERQKIYIEESKQTAAKRRQKGKLVTGCEGACDGPLRRSTMSQAPPTTQEHA